jgi:hypothetical protein
MRQFLHTLLLVIFIGAPLLAQENVVRYKVSFPHVSLKSNRGERIYAVNVVMHCGRFTAINRIPNDWSATVVSPVSEETTLRMEAGHGTSALWHSEDLDGFVTVLFAEEPQSCFDIKASMKVAYYDGNNLHERDISFQQNRLVLKREPQRRMIGEKFPITPTVPGIPPVSARLTMLFRRFAAPTCKACARGS